MMSSSVSTATMPVLRAQGPSLVLDSAPVPACPVDGALVTLSGVGLCGSDVEKLVTSKAQPGQILGHEVVGVIRELGPEAPSMASGVPWQVGQRVVTSHHVPCQNQSGDCRYCAHTSESMCETFKQSNLQPGGFASVFALSAAHLTHTVIPIPDSVSDAAACAVEPLACVAKGLRRAEALTGPLVHAGDTALIVGLGYIGLLAAMAYRARYGATVRLVGVDISPERRALAVTVLGEGFLDGVSSGEELPADVVADQVFVSVVMEPTVALALAHVRSGGVVVPFSRGLDGVAAFNANDVYYREIAVVPSYSPNLADLRQSADWIFSGLAKVSPLVTHTLGFAHANDGLALYQSGQALKVLLTP